MSLESQIKWIAEEREKALVKHHAKRKDDYANSIIPIKTGCEQDEPDIVSSFHIFFINIIYFLTCV
jgi:hypothetical protein